MSKRYTAIGVKIDNESGKSTKAKSTLTVDPSEKVTKENEKIKEDEVKKKEGTSPINSGEIKSLVQNECKDVKKSSSSVETGAQPVAKSPTTLKKMGVTPRLKKLSIESSPLLPIDEKFRKRWHIEGIIGKGGYGEIYLAIDMQWAEEVAIKAEPKTRKGKVAKRMILEQEVLVKMQGKPHVPIMFGSGHTDKLNYIILQLLSINLGDIRRMSPTRRLSRSTVGRITVQSIAALRDLHEICYLHRDVKPGNMCFGISPKNRHVLMLLDFGLVRRYKDSDGEWRVPREKAGFRGTQRYVSARVHNRLEQTPSDDMTSLMYTSIELLSGELPWKNLEKSEDICRIKEAVLAGRMEMFNQTVRELSPFIKLVSGLDPSAELPYSTLQASVKKMYLPKKLVDLYDWEENFKEALCERTISTDESIKEP